MFGGEVAVGFNILRGRSIGAKREASGGAVCKSWVSVVSAWPHFPALNTTWGKSITAGPGLDLGITVRV